MDLQDWGSVDVVWLVKKLLDDGDMLVDVGANIGLVTLPVAMDGHPVLALEMLPANCLKLHIACGLNGLNGVRVVQGAASSFDGLLTYGGEHAWGTVGTGDQVACALRLDTVLRLHDLRPSRRLVLKLDVEGHELEVLKGAAQLIAAHRPCIVFESIEFADGDEAQVSKQCKRLLADLGYRLFLQRGQTLLPRGAGDLQEGLVTDFLALPNERADLLERFDIRDLSPEERAAWVHEMALEHNPLHRRHAVAAVKLLRREDRYVALTEASVAQLVTDDDPTVRELAQAARF